MFGLFPGYKYYKRKIEKLFEFADRNLVHSYFGEQLIDSLIKYMVLQLALYAEGENPVTDESLWLSATPVATDFIRLYNRFNKEFKYPIVHGDDPFALSEDNFSKGLSAARYAVGYCLTLYSQDHLKYAGFKNWADNFVFHSIEKYFYDKAPTENDIRRKLVNAVYDIGPVCENFEEVQRWPFPLKHADLNASFNHHPVLNRFFSAD